MEKGEYLACKTREAEIISLQMSLTKPKGSLATLIPGRDDAQCRSQESCPPCCTWHLALLCQNASIHCPISNQILENEFWEKILLFFGRAWMLFFFGWQLVWLDLVLFFFKACQFLGLLHNMTRCTVVPEHRQNPMAQGRKEQEL